MLWFTFCWIFLSRILIILLCLGEFRIALLNSDFLSYLLCISMLRSRTLLASSLLSFVISHNLLLCFSSLSFIRFLCFLLHFILNFFFFIYYFQLFWIFLFLFLYTLISLSFFWFLRYLNVHISWSGSRSFTCILLLSSDWFKLGLSNNRCTCILFLLPFNKISFLRNTKFI